MSVVELQYPLELRRVLEPENEAASVEVDPNSSEEMKAFLSTSISRWLESDKFMWMKLGQRYYDNENDINMRCRTVIGKSGEMVKAPYLANNKLSHAFLKKLTKQKTGYLLSKPFTVTSDNVEFQKTLQEYFDEDFLRMLKNGGKDAVVQGLGWIQVYYSDDGVLSFKRIPPEEIIPFWKDIDHTVLEAAIRVYVKVEFHGSQVIPVKHVQYFTPNAVYNFVQEANTLMPDSTTPVDYNIRVTSEESTEYYMWNRIPLIPLKYNDEEVPLLKFVKSLIDDYDSRASDVSNSIEDEPNQIKVVKDYDGTDKGEFVYNLARYRVLFLRGTGSVDTLNTTLNTDSIESHLTRLRKDIFEFGGGVDTQNKDLSDTSGVALKFLYSDLDMDCLDFGNELAWALKQIGWFIKQDQLLNYGKNYVDATFEVAFNTDITINETETINNIVNSAGIVSRRTLLTQHPFVTDVDTELKAVQEEEEAALAALETSNTTANNTPTRTT